MPYRLICKVSEVYLIFLRGPDCRRIRICAAPCRINQVHNVETRNIEKRAIPIPMCGDAKKKKTGGFKRLQGTRERVENVCLQRKMKDILKIYHRTFSS